MTRVLTLSGRFCLIVETCRALRAGVRNVRFIRIGLFRQDFGRPNQLLSFLLLPPLGSLMGH